MEARRRPCLKPPIAEAPRKPTEMAKPGFVEPHPRISKSGGPELRKLFFSAFLSETLLRRHLGRGGALESHGGRALGARERPAWAIDLFLFDGSVEVLFRALGMCGVTVRGWPGDGGLGLGFRLCVQGLGLRVPGKGPLAHERARGFGVCCKVPYSFTSSGWLQVLCLDLGFWGFRV